MQFKSTFVFAFCLSSLSAFSQSFYFGADLSYVNEMEDCGVVYKEQGQPKDVYQIFADHHCNLVRLRLWHTPSWYDALNAGKRYSDFQDVRKSIIRARAQGMSVLLDFHLSDNWADPSHQVMPAAWLGVVDNLPRLKDSLYNYISKTLLDLNNEGLLPEMVQIGNETNKGILLSPAVDAAGWSLDWNRNSQLFKRAIQSVRDVENTTGKTIKVALHIAGPAEADWLMAGFWANGVTDFDVIGLSYYWAWHKPTSIADAGNIVAELRQLYPGKEVMIFETGYPWTLQWEDSANNLITELNPSYAPASPDNQRKWLVDMTQAVINKGAKGVMYWEPAWQSSSCWTQWGKGSHQEHATFFDFQDNLLTGGGMDFMTHDYANLVSVQEQTPRLSFKVWPDSGQRNLWLRLEGFSVDKPLEVKLSNAKGELLASRKFDSIAAPELLFQIPALPAGLYYCAVYEGNIFRAVRSVALGE
ncbi:MAG: glycosyl hydrolase 53 family protein [Phycisphaerae bacterium]|nr:glycosyl hydrolase 53 family protein [Saprospiraceae bacterium]